MDDLQKREMKIQALTNRIAEMTAMYEGALADSRVLITDLDQQLTAAKEELDGLKAESEVKTVAKGKANVEKKAE